MSRHATLPSITHQLRPQLAVDFFKQTFNIKKASNAGLSRRTDKESHYTKPSREE